jgi:uncharacterized DUF497 family protein
MQFEFDPVKSSANKAKHGIDFEEAQKLWLDKNALRIRARNTGEERFAIVAELNLKLWFAVYTERGPNIRIITVRRARDNEKAHYHGRENR